MHGAKARIHKSGGFAAMHADAFAHAAARRGLSGLVALFLLSFGKTLDPLTWFYVTSASIGYICMVVHCMVEVNGKGAWRSIA